MQLVTPLEHARLVIPAAATKAETLSEFMSENGCKGVTKHTGRPKHDRQS